MLLNDSFEHLFVIAVNRFPLNDILHHHLHSVFCHTLAKHFLLKIHKCTYLVGEDVLPRHSLLYSTFMVLNAINPLKIKGYPATELQKPSLPAVSSNYSRPVPGAGRSVVLHNRVFGN